MRVLVTGAAGFLGSHLARALLARGEDVVALDDFSTGVQGSVPEGVRLVPGDVRDVAAVGEAVEGCAAVLHFAAAVGTRLVARDPAGTWSRNVEGTAVVLRAAARAGARVLVASSSEVYGPSAPVPLAEEDPVRLDLGGRREVYALSKAAGEAYALALGRAERLRATVARLFNVVGPGQSDRYGMVLPRFVAAARAGRPLPVHGDGTQRRCFLHVADAVRALLALLQAPEAVGAVVNVGDDRETSILDLARVVLVESGSHAGVRHVPFASVYGADFVDPPRRVPALGRLRALTGFIPAHDVRDAVRDLLASPLATSLV